MVSVKLLGPCQNVPCMIMQTIESLATYLTIYSLYIGDSLMRIDLPAFHSPIYMNIQRIVSHHSDGLVPLTIFAENLLHSVLT